MFLEKWTAASHHTALSDPPCVLDCAPVGLKADARSAFLVNFVRIGENICQHTVTEHKCSI